jgi:hypothetical protein
MDDVEECFGIVPLQSLFCHIRCAGRTFQDQAASQKVVQHIFISPKSNLVHSPV